MAGTFSRITTLLGAVAILLVGHGLQLTLLPVYAQAAGWTNSAIGITGSFYFLGFVVGCIVNPRIVSGVGHIRAFMVMAAIATFAVLGVALFVSVPAWMLLRFATGFALAGLYMVIESWLSEVSPREQRGRVLAVYTLISLVGMACGQWLMGVEVGEPLQRFMIAGLLIVIAIVPVGLTRVQSPQPIPAIRFTPRLLARASRVAIVASALAGMVTGAFWSMGPLLGRSAGLDAGEVGLLMSAGIFGGALVQLPIGRLSDTLDRRLVIGALATLGTLVCLAGWYLVGDSALVLYAIVFCLGASALPLYALCIAHASDRATMTLVEITSSVLIVNGMGAVLGPTLVAPLMDALGPRVFFGYCTICLALAASWAFYRMLVVERVRHEGHAVILPRTTQAVAGLPEAAAGEHEPAEQAPQSNGPTVMDDTQPLQ
jgi:MFS family permease